MKAFLIYLVSVAAFLLAFTVVSRITENHNIHVDCLRLSEGTGLPTRVAGPMLGRKCFVQVDGKWVPASQWRAP